MTSTIPKPEVATTVEVTIDGIPMRVPEGTSLLKAARQAGCEIPTLCFLEGINEIGGCRLCVVEVAGRSELVTACNTPAEADMEIFTHSKRVESARKNVLSLLLANHRYDCTNCVKEGDCALQDHAVEYGVDGTRFRGDRELLSSDRAKVETHPFLSFDPGLCILCDRCVSMCNITVGRSAINTAKAGKFTVLDAPFGADWDHSLCESCGNCAQVCPTAAITEKRRRRYRASEVRKVRTTCPHCGTGCKIDLIIKDGRIVDTEGANEAPNYGLMCVKGRSGSFDFVHAGDRLTTPLIKNRLTGKFEPASWDDALDLVANTFLALRDKYGPDSLAGFACSRSPNEDVYMTQKFVRACFKTNNVDNCARVCHSASVAGLAMTLGSGAMTNPISDITSGVDCIMLIGSNPEEAHPIVGLKIREAVQSGTRLIVVDPREIGLCQDADIHLKIKPGTNVAFANGMLHVMIEENLVDHEYIESRTEGFDIVKDIVADYTPERVGEICHLDPEMLREAARMYARAKKAPIIYCLGVTEHSTGTEGVMSLSNMAMACGKIGKPGCGINPLRGQNNVQGGCDMGALPGDFPGYQKVTSESVVEKFEKAWGVELNRKPGIHATDVFGAAIRGEVKGLFIYGEDPVVTDADTNHIIGALKSLEFFVVCELFMTETAQFADVILPGLSYAEKEGTFTNTERRFQRTHKAVEVGGDMRLETEMLADLMRRMGYDQPTLTSAEIMDEIASLTPSFGGISHQRLDTEGSIQWPCPSPEHPGTPILHIDKFTRGTGWFFPAYYRSSAELPCEEYPIILMTGRVLAHYTTRAMTGRTPGLMEIEGSSFIEVNEEDAAKLGFVDGDRLRLTSRRGQIESTARVGNKVSPGETWMPFHFPDGNANWLTNAALDDYARIPEYKVCAIRMEKA